MGVAEDLPWGRQTLWLSPKITCCPPSSSTCLSYSERRGLNQDSECLLGVCVCVFSCSLQLSSVAQSCLTLCDPMDCSTPGLPVRYQLPELTQIRVHWVSDAIQPSHSLSPLLLPPSIFPSIRVFSNESTLHIRWPKYFSFSFNISPSNEYSGLISFRKDWLDLLAVQRTLKSLLLHQSSKTSVLGGSAFFIAQLSHPYMATGKTIALTSRPLLAK